MSAIGEKYKQLIDDLYSSTINKSLAWEEDWSGEIFASLGGKEIYLSSSRTSNGEPLEVIEIKNGDQVIDYFNDHSVNRFTNVEGFLNYYEKMKELRMLATRQARGADQAIDDVLKALKER